VKLLLCVHHELDPNAGAPGATLALGSELARLGHSVSYLSHDDLPSRLPGLGRELLFPELAGLAIARRARDVDVVDASTGDAWLWARAGRRRSRTSPALVTRSHGLEHRFWEEEVAEARAEGRRIPLRTGLYHGRWRLREVAASLRASDACVFLNGRDRDYAIDRLGVAPDRAHVVANGIPASFLGRQLDEEPAAGELRIAHIGSWAERKGKRFLASALGPLLDRRQDVRLTLVGTRAPEEDVRTAFPDAARPRVTVVPDYDHERLPELLAGHRIVVSASLAEGFSLALPEAMACGLAPVATAVGGAPELIEDGVSGILVPPRDAEALETAVAGLLDSPERLDGLRRGARDTAQRYSWEAIARDNLDVYEAARGYAAGRSASAIT
jgi:glycosyltransferase involved in cell wall biosynthesis